MNDLDLTSNDISYICSNGCSSICCCRKVSIDALASQCYWWPKERQRLSYIHQQKDHGETSRRHQCLALAPSISLPISLQLGLPESFAEFFHSFILATWYRPDRLANVQDLEEGNRNCPNEIFSNRAYRSSLTRHVVQILVQLREYVQQFRPTEKIPTVQALGEVSCRTKASSNPVRKSNIEIPGHHSSQTRYVVQNYSGTTMKEEFT